MFIRDVTVTEFNCLSRNIQTDIALKYLGKLLLYKSVKWNASELKSVTLKGTRHIGRFLFRDNFWCEHFSVNCASYAWHWMFAWIIEDLSRKDWLLFTSSSFCMVAGISTCRWTVPFSFLGFFLNCRCKKDNLLYRNHESKTCNLYLCQLGTLVADYFCSSISCSVQALQHSIDTRKLGAVPHCHC